jgi:hypothetical protein
MQGVQTVAGVIAASGGSDGVEVGYPSRDPVFPPDGTDGTDVEMLLARWRDCRE